MADRTLTFDSSFTVTVDGESVTSPYILTKSCVIHASNPDGDASALHMNGETWASLPYPLVVEDENISLTWIGGMVNPGGPSGLTINYEAASVPTPDWANCFVKTASGNKAVEKVWIKQNGQLVQIFGEQSIAKNYAFQWNSSSSNWWNNYLWLVLNDISYSDPPKTLPDLTSGVAVTIKLYDEDDESSPGQGRFALYDSSGQLITPIEFVGVNCDSEGYFYLPSYLGEINGTITPPYYENGATIIFEYK